MFTLELELNIFWSGILGAESGHCGAFTEHTRRSYSRGEWAARSLDLVVCAKRHHRHDDDDGGCSRAFQGGSVVSWLWVQARPLSALPPLDALFHAPPCSSQCSKTRQRASSAPSTRSSAAASPRSPIYELNR